MKGSSRAELAPAGDDDMSAIVPMRLGGTRRESN